MSADRTLHIEALTAAARSSLAAASFRSLKLSKPIPNSASGAEQVDIECFAKAKQIMLRAISLKGELHLSVLYRFATKDITKNLKPEAAWQSVQTWLTDTFANAHLVTETHDMQLITSRKGTAQLLRTRAQTHASADTAVPAPTHDRAKVRLITLDAAFLSPLGITQRGPSGAPILVPAMANKFKQINKFLELFHSSLEKSGLADKADLRVLDFGAGKGYLSFALDHYLSARPKPSAHVDVGRAAKAALIDAGRADKLALIDAGRADRSAHAVLAVELRAELVEAGNAICASLAKNLSAQPTLQFIAGDVRTHAAKQVDVMVALHACDTATDHAIAFGIRNQARVILCSPCCHKQLRPQIKMPNVLAPLLQHGIHLGQEAEMLTDGLRALLLEACGYQTQVFEFIATEHTAKNKMILAVQRKTPMSGAHKAELDAQIASLKAFYGVREHCLEELLAQSVG